MDFRFGDGRDWFFEKRFGLFLHWGIYAIDAWHEQMQYSKQVPRKVYEQLIHKFNPVRFDPDSWLDIAEEAGMEYVCFTTKHIDGFCMFDTKYTDYNIMNTPYGKDILGMLTDACHRRGFPVCLYYNAVNLHHPNYPNQGRTYELPAPEEGDEPDIGRYMDFLRDQVAELCTNYGEIKGFWWDTGDVPGYRDESINEMIRRLQPNAVINNRGFGEGDFGTPERDWDEFVEKDQVFSKPTEACQSIGYESWGYREDEDFYSDRYLSESIDKVLAKGGNYLLNVGPKADGTFPEEACRILRTIGGWYRKVRVSLNDVDTVIGLVSDSNIIITRKENKLFVHLNKFPAAGCVWLNSIDIMPQKAVLLNNGEALEARVELTPSHNNKDKKCLRIRNLPVNDYPNEVMIIELEFEELP